MEELASIVARALILISQAVAAGQLCTASGKRLRKSLLMNPSRFSDRFNLL